MAYRNCMKGGTTHIDALHPNQNIVPVLLNGVYDDNGISKKKNHNTHYTNVSLFVRYFQKFNYQFIHAPPAPRTTRLCNNA